MIWFLFIAMTITALALVFWPFFKANLMDVSYDTEETTHSHEIEVYKDQLNEVERDLKSGMLTKQEAEAASLEISRRMLASAEALENIETAEKTVAAQVKAEKTNVEPEKVVQTAKKSDIIKGATGKDKDPSSDKTAVKKYEKITKPLGVLAQKSNERWAKLDQLKQIGLASSFAVGIFALGLYGFYGSPFRPDLPYAQRFADKVLSAPLQKEMAELEVYLQTNDKDGKAWQKMAAFYMNKGSFHKAAFAFRKSIQILGENPSRLTGFAEATVMVNKGKVTDVAMAAYTRALKIDPDLVEARVRLAMGLEQKGAKSAALKAYRHVLKRSAKGAPWIGFIEKRITALTGKPIVKKRTAEEKHIDSLIEKVEASLKKSPKEGRGWNVIAPVYLTRGRYKDAKMAFEKAIALLGEDAKRLSGLGEAITLMQNGEITQEAQKYFKKALTFDPKMIEPTIRLAMALEQKGDLKNASKAYQDIITKGGPKTPWYPIIKERVEFVNAALKGTSSKPRMSMAQNNASNSISGKITDKGPTTEQVKDAAAMSVTDRQAMINQMVSNLAGRLEEDGKDLGGWVKLLNAYNVLGKKDEAGKALSKARTIFKDNQQAMNQLASVAKGLGLQ